MKKADAVEHLDRAGHTINELNASAWNVAFKPEQYGWASSLFSLASIPVLSAASIGQLVTSTVVRQINPDFFARVTGSGGDTGSRGSTGDTTP